MHSFQCYHIIMFIMQVQEAPISNKVSAVISNHGSLPDMTRDFTLCHNIQSGSRSHLFSSACWAYKVASAWS